MLIRYVLISASDISQPVYQSGSRIGSFEMVSQMLPGNFDFKIQNYFDLWSCNLYLKCIYILGSHIFDSVLHYINNYF